MNLRVESLFSKIVAWIVTSLIFFVYVLGKDSLHVTTHNVFGIIVLVTLVYELFVWFFNQLFVFFSKQRRQTQQKEADSNVINSK